ncbi:hypothetical protein AeNC1_018258 [Aphanomyces euteiches]|nr:hypothetical protein AeNC1_018258 [Aphanomyces euteiches]
MNDNAELQQEFDKALVTVAQLQVKALAWRQTHPGDQDSNPEWIEHLMDLKNAYTKVKNANFRLLGASEPVEAVASEAVPGEYSESGGAEAVEGDAVRSSGNGGEPEGTDGRVPADGEEPEGADREGTGDTNSTQIQEIPDRNRERKCAQLIRVDFGCDFVLLVVGTVLLGISFHPHNPVWGMSCGLVVLTFVRLCFEARTLWRGDS